MVFGACQPKCKESALACEIESAKVLCTNILNCIIMGWETQDRRELLFSRPALP
jgi:hypothetical protein